MLSRAEGGRLKRVDLARRLVLTPSGVTRLLEGLEAAGLVERARARRPPRHVRAAHRGGSRSAPGRVVRPRGLDSRAPGEAPEPGRARASRRPARQALRGKRRARLARSERPASGAHSGIPASGTRFNPVMRTMDDIRAELERASNGEPSSGTSSATASTPPSRRRPRELSRTIDELWAEARALRAYGRFGPSDAIRARARAEERLERDSRSSRPPSRRPGEGGSGRLLR